MLAGWPAPRGAVPGLCTLSTGLQEERALLDQTRTSPTASVDGSGAGLPDGVSTFRVLYPDLHGVARGKDIPVAELERAQRGLNFCWAVMGTDLRHTPVVGGESGYPDMLATPDPATLSRLPYEPDVAVALADLTRDGEPEPTDMRHLVRRAEAALDSLGVAAKVGPELEFFLCEEDGEGGWRRHVDNLSMVYTVGPQADPAGMLKAMLDCCAELGHRRDRGQPRVHEQPVRDQHLGDRSARRRRQRVPLQVRRQGHGGAAGMLATFMGKPFNDQGGSGHHLHLSLERDGANCFDDPDGRDGLADELRHFTAGVIEHAPALIAFLNPTINAYRRILPDSLAPTHCNWGLDNRTTFIRIPAERGGASRLEIRVGDGACQPVPDRRRRDLRRRRRAPP